LAKFLYPAGFLGRSPHMREDKGSTVVADPTIFSNQSHAKTNINYPRLSLFSNSYKECDI